MSLYSAQSRPYAHSCLVVASASSTQADWAQALDALATVFRNENAASVLCRPGIPANQLERLLLDAAGDLAKMPKLINNLVKLLIENHRLPMLPDIASTFRRLWQEQTDRVSVEIHTAFDLSDEQHQRLCAALKKRLGAEPDTTVVVNPELGGGVSVYIGDDVIDSSLRAHLRKFEQSVTYS